MVPNEAGRNMNEAPRNMNEEHSTRTGGGAGAEEINNRNTFSKQANVDRIKAHYNDVNINNSQPPKPFKKI